MTRRPNPTGLAVLRQATDHLRRADPVMRRLVDTVGACGLRADARGGVFAALVESMLYQQLNGRAAATIHARLRARLGRRHPRPADVEALSDQDLRGVGFSRQKIVSVRDLTARVRNGLSLRGLGRLDDEDVIERLTVVKGVGRWTAEMLLMFRLGRLDVLPVGDYGVRQGMRRAYRLRALPEPERMRRLAEPWRPYRSVACWYLWRVAESKGRLAGA